MRLQPLAIFILMALAGNAAAYNDTGSRFTFGPGYMGINIFGEGGNDSYYLRPSFNTYKSDGADRRSSYSLGAGLDGSALSVGTEFSITPESGGYKNSSAYADLTWNLLGETAEDSILEDLALGIFGSVTAHEDDYSLSTATVSSGGGGGGGGGGSGGGGGGVSVSTLDESFKLKQTDYGISASVKLYGLRASGRFSRTVYDKDVTAEVRRLPVDIGGIGTSGFPDTALSARLGCPGLPLSPRAGYSKTTYLLDQPDSETVSAGLSVRAGPAEISAGWENFNPGGGAARSDYYSLGLTFSF